MFSFRVAHEIAFKIYCYNFRKFYKNNFVICRDKFRDCVRSFAALFFEYFELQSNSVTGQKIINSEKCFFDEWHDNNNKMTYGPFIVFLFHPSMNEWKRTIDIYMLNVVKYEMTLRVRINNYLWFNRTFYLNIWWKSDKTKIERFTEFSLLSARRRHILECNEAHKYIRSGFEPDVTNGHVMPVPFISKTFYWVKTDADRRRRRLTIVAATISLFLLPLEHLFLQTMKTI